MRKCKNIGLTLLLISSVSISALNLLFDLNSTRQEDVEVYCAIGCPGIFFVGGLLCFGAIWLWIERQMSKKEETDKRHSFANIYQDGEGRFLGDTEYHTHAEALRFRDKLSSYVETVEIVRRGM